MTLFIHIGQHRTGTTFFQDFCLVNEALLRSYGLNYCKTGRRGNNHSAFAINISTPKRREVLNSFYDNKKGTGLYSDYQGPDLTELITDLLVEMKHSVCQQHLISSESFLEWTQPEKLKELLFKYAIDVQIIAFVRHPKFWIESVYSQVVKDPDLLFSSELDTLPQLFMLDYESQFLPWAEAFGLDAIHFYPYLENVGSQYHITQLMNLLLAESFPYFNWPRDKINASLDSCCVEQLKKINSKGFSATRRAQLLEQLSEISFFFQKLRVFDKWTCDKRLWGGFIIFMIRKTMILYALLVYFGCWSSLYLNQRRFNG